jgi:RecA-family ATPase
VTLFSGEGGTGKSLASLQLLVAMALGYEWLGQEVTQGGGLYFGAEDEVDEMHIRLAAIIGHEKRTFADLAERAVRLIPMADREAILAEPNKSGKMLETAIFPLLKAHVESLRPKLIIIDTSADAFGGDEINRKQVRAFVKLLRTLAIRFDCAVLLLSHPSLTGISSGSGLSGSTAWNGSVRSRLYMTADDEDDDVRKIKTMKSNYGRKGSEIAVRWTEGVFVVDEGPDPAVGNFINKKSEEVFIELLHLFTVQGQNVGVATGTSYAPAKMVGHPKAKGISKKQLAEAMQRLLDAGRIRLVTDGPPSRPRSRLEVVETGAKG